ncbi:hypothetical protein AB0M83_23905 [Amycolatopsis sp. NPDC051106]|jgi:membrane-bound lytic murein transglycosylase|uniref:hypothetical protein n=1 Tax=unclassified Amycolatopsis TaxID=2618356 RepID=UPI003420FD7A
MIKRALAGLAVAAVIGTLGAPVAAAASGSGDPAVRPPGQCVWIWTEGPPQCKKLE